MNKEELIATLEGYLDGKLSEGERSGLEARLASDTALAEDLELLRDLRYIVASEEAEQQLKEKLEAAAAPYFGSKAASPKRVIFNRKRLAIAASLLVLGLVGWYYFSSRPLSDEQLMAAYFSPPPSFGLYRSGDEPATGLAAVGNQVDSLYRLRQYPEALTLMRQIEPIFSKNPSSGFFFQLGLLYLLNGEPAKTLEAFEKVQNSYQNDKAWYTAWAHLKAGDRQAAKAVFEEIAQSGSPYREQAAEVLGKME